MTGITWGQLGSHSNILLLRPVCCSFSSFLKSDSSGLGILSEKHAYDNWVFSRGNWAKGLLPMQKAFSQGILCQISLLSPLPLLFPPTYCIIFFRVPWFSGNLVGRGSIWQGCSTLLIHMCVWSIKHILDNFYHSFLIDHLFYNLNEVYPLCWKMLSIFI